MYRHIAAGWSYNKMMNAHTREFDEMPTTSLRHHHHHHHHQTDGKFSSAIKAAATFSI
jgi:hypothetical protein